MLVALFTGNDNAEEKPMCTLCDEGIPQIHSSSRRALPWRTTGTRPRTAAGLGDATSFAAVP